MNLLLVIDLQNEFINENTIDSIKMIKELINTNNYDKVLFTQYVNDENNPTYKTLKWHGCLSDESKKICIDVSNYDVIKKHTYSAYNDELKKYLDDNYVENIYLCGIDIECCVLVTAFNLFENDYNVYVLKDYVYCMNGIADKNNAISILKRNIGNNSII